MHDAEQSKVHSDPLYVMENPSAFSVYTSNMVNMSTGVKGLENQWYNFGGDEVEKSLSTNKKTGLSTEDAKRRLDQSGQSLF